MSIWFAVEAKDAAIYGIISALVGVDIQQILFLALLIIGCFLVFMCLCGGCIAVKRFCFVQCIFAIFLTLSMLILLTLGVILIVVTNMVAEEMDKACGTSASSDDIAEAFNELYTTADTIYCVASNGCICYDSDRATGGGFSSTETSSTVVKVQECTAYLESAYADYGVSFDDINDIIEYLDYFGEIEQDYSCSGICLQKSYYYFSDINKGDPSKTCFDAIKNDLILGDVQGYGIGYTVSGCLLFVIWFIQYGLCCRKNLNARQGQTKQF